MAGSAGRASARLVAGCLASYRERVRDSLWALAVAVEQRVALQSAQAWQELLRLDVLQMAVFLVLAPAVVAARVAARRLQVRVVLCLAWLLLQEHLVESVSRQARRVPGLRASGPQVRRPERGRAPAHGQAPRKSARPPLVLARAQALREWSARGRTVWSRRPVPVAAVALRVLLPASFAQIVRLCPWPLSPPSPPLRRQPPRRRLPSSAYGPSPPHLQGWSSSAFSFP